MHYSDRAALRQAATAPADSGLRRYVAKVYGLMGIGLSISGGVAYATSLNLSLVYVLFQSTITRFLVVFAPFILAMVLGTAIHRMSKQVALGVFIAYAALMGLSLSSVFLVFQSGSIASIFGVSSGLFLGMGAYGYATKKDLTAFGSFLFMGLIGLIISVVVNAFLHNSLLTTILSALTVVIFTGLTAYDAQQIRLSYRLANDETSTTRLAVIGALNLYLCFINIFLSLLRLFGARK
ncbi:MAG: Bax inhibitor-1/YccA family protein [Holosporales bacterium]|jgi:FtsH-binding integral membrane protein|nr:Bax inhibitor-1/YccA family protein [Holosporales bacterium]